MCAKFDDSSISHSRDITGDQKFKLCHVTLTTPLLSVISLSAYKIWRL